MSEKPLGKFLLKRSSNLYSSNLLLTKLKVKIPSLKERNNSSSTESILLKLIFEGRLNFEIL